MPANPVPRRGEGLFERLGRRLRSRRAIVVDRSMEPTLRPGDRILYDPGAYEGRVPRAGDLVLLFDPDGSGRRLIKRVAGGPGDLVRFGPTGMATREEPRPAPVVATDGVRVPPDHIFVAADHAAAGRDSRSFGPVALDRVIGRAWFRYAPGERRGRLDES